MPLAQLRGVDMTHARGTVGETAVFRGFDFAVEEGEFVSVVGSNGSGKTTLLNLLCGGVTPDAGQILLDGRDVTDLPEHRRAARIGRVFQDPAMGTCPRLTVLENLSLAAGKGAPFGLRRGVPRGRTQELRARLAALGMGLEDKLDRPVGTLSGGQRQALSLLLSTMTPLRLLVLDEHTAALDPRSSETVMALTDRLVKEKHLTAIMVTHNLRHAVEYGTRLVMMDRGTCVVDTGADGKGAWQVPDLLKVFNEISVECGN